MANISPLNPLGYLLKRQYTGSAEVKYRLFKERFARARNLYRKDLFAHYGCVNAIEFSDEGELLVSGKQAWRLAHLCFSYLLLILFIFIYVFFSCCSIRALTHVHHL